MRRCNPLPYVQYGCGVAPCLAKKSIGFILSNQLRDTALAVANRVQWDPRNSVGSEVLDAQHQALLAHCNALADCLAEAGPDGDEKFRRIFGELMARSREHFAAEEALLARAGYPDLEAHRHEREEFDYLAAEIVTTEHFDRDELQTFLALWWSGHILGSVKKQRPFLEQPAG